MIANRCLCGCGLAGARGIAIAGAPDGEPAPLLAGSICGPSLNGGLRSVVGDYPPAIGRSTAELYCLRPPKQRAGQAPRDPRAVVLARLDQAG